MRLPSVVYKILLLLFIIAGFGTVSILIMTQSSGQNKTQKAEDVVFSAPLRQTNWQDIGVVAEPIFALPVKTKTGFTDHEFLLDTGAVISSLPREMAEETGQDLAFLKRSTFAGFGNTRSFAYQGEMDVKIGSIEERVPVVFTESAGTKSLLGRKGFFDKYSIYFNHYDSTVEIRK
jgi:hypothetical protein